MAEVMFQNVAYRATVYRTGLLTGFFPSISNFYFTVQPRPTAQMVDLMFHNVIYRATVYRTGLYILQEYKEMFDFLNFVYIIEDWKQ